MEKLKKLKELEGLEELEELEENIDNIEDIIKNNKSYIILYYTAVWCKPCQSIYPSICKLNKELNNIIFYKIDITKNDNYIETKNIDSIPTFQLYYNSNLLGESKGANINKLGELLKKYIKTI